MGLWCQAGIPPIRLLHPTWLRIRNWNTTNGKIHFGEVPFGAPSGFHRFHAPIESRWRRKASDVIIIPERERTRYRGRIVGLTSVSGVLALWPCSLVQHSWHHLRCPFLNDVTVQQIGFCWCYRSLSFSFSFLSRLDGLLWWRMWILFLFVSLSYGTIQVWCFEFRQPAQYLSAIGIKPSQQLVFRIRARLRILRPQESNDNPEDKTVEMKTSRVLPTGHLVSSVGSQQWKSSTSSPCPTRRSSPPKSPLQFPLRSAVICVDSPMGSLHLLRTWSIPACVCLYPGPSVLRMFVINCTQGILLIVV